MCVVFCVHGVSGMGILFDIFGKKKETVSTLTFFEVYFGIISGGLFEAFPTSIHWCIFFEVHSDAIRTDLKHTSNIVKSDVTYERYEVSDQFCHLFLTNVWLG